MNRVTFESKHMEWGTPKYVFEHFNNHFQFDFDAAAKNRDCAMLPIFITPEENALKQNWSLYGRRAWLNPPYGRQVSKWVEKAYTEVRSGNIDICGLLIFARTDTKWWHNYIRYCNQIHFITGRIKFINHDSKEQTYAAPAPSVFILIQGTEDMVPNVFFG